MKTLISPREGRYNPQVEMALSVCRDLPDSPAWAVMRDLLCRRSTRNRERIFRLSKRLPYDREALSELLRLHGEEDLIDYLTRDPERLGTDLADAALTMLPAIPPENGTMEKA